MIENQQKHTHKHLRYWTCRAQTRIPPHLISTITLSGRHYYYLLFKDNEIEAQKASDLPTVPRPAGRRAVVQQAGCLCHLCMARPGRPPPSEVLEG